MKRILTTLILLFSTISWSQMAQDSLVYWIPNAFTPNGNEYNQYWGPEFVNGYSHDHFRLWVFNRRGGVVWESNDPSAKWDGTYNGHPVQDGTYTWVIIFDVLINDKKNYINGHVTVLR